MYRFFLNGFVQGIALFIALGVSFSGKLDSKGTLVAVLLAGIIGAIGIWTHLSTTWWKKLVAVAMYGCLLVAFYFYLTGKKGEEPKAHSRVEWDEPAGVKSLVTDKPIHLLLPFHDGEVPEFNLGVRNVGDYPLQCRQMKALVVIASFRDASNMFQKYSRDLSQAESECSGGVLNPHERNFLYYHTFIGQPLRHDQVVALDQGKDALYVMGLFIWEDRSGTYETDFSQLLVAELPDEGFNWHINDDNNVEHKLENKVEHKLNGLIHTIRELPFYRP